MSDRKTTVPSSIPAGVTISTNGKSTNSNQQTVANLLQTVPGGHSVQYDADGGLFDTVSNIFVRPENTNLRRQ